MRRLLAAARCWRSRRRLRQGHRGPRARRLRGRGHQARAAGRRARAARRGHRADRGRHPRPGVEHVLGDRPQRRRRRRAPDGRLGHLPRRPTRSRVERMRELIDEAVDGKPDGLVVSIPDPAVGAGDPARRARRHPGRLDQLGRGPVAPASGSSPTSASPRTRAGLRGRRAAGGGRRAQRALHQPGGRQQGARRSLRGVRARRCARPAARSQRARARRRGPQRRRAQARRRDRAAQGRRRARAQRRRRGRRRSTPRSSAAARRASRSARSTSRPRCSRRSRTGGSCFAVDQQAYLQGYLPIVMLTQRGRYGLFPLTRRGGRHRPELRDARDRAARAAAQRAGDPLITRPASIAVRAV